MVIYQHRIFRKDLKNNPTVLYLFGDNRLRKGLGGQAREMRGEPNALGIRTKKVPNNHPLSFLSDDEYEKNTNDIEKEI